jgi:hypothetical protein
MEYSSTRLEEYIRAAGNNFPASMTSKKWSGKNVQHF